VFLRASVGFEINRWINCHQRWIMLHWVFIGFQIQSR